MQADAAALPDSLRGGFDVAYATIGAICWIEDIGAWMRCAAATLRPGGRLVLVEIHPLYAMVEAAGEPLRLDFPYAFDGPRRFDEPGSYADPDAPVQATAEVVFAHSLGEIVNAAIAAGLRIDALHEHLETDLDPRGNLLTRGEDGRYRLEVSGERLPVLFTLIATRPLTTPAHAGDTTECYIEARAAVDRSVRPAAAQTATRGSSKAQLLPAGEGGAEACGLPSRTHTQQLDTMPEWTATNRTSSSSAIRSR